MREIRRFWQHQRVKAAQREARLVAGQGEDTAGPEEPAGTGSAGRDNGSRPV